MKTHDTLTILEAKSVAAQVDGAFKIIGSDLLFEKVKSPDDKGRWFKARAVNENCGAYDLTIFTDGVYGISPFLKLPYFIAVSSDEESYTVMTRYPNGPVESIFDLRNPWKPKALDLKGEDLNTDSGRLIRVMMTGYGIVRYHLVDSLITDDPNVIPIFIPEFNVVANAFVCMIGKRKALTLQGLMNVSNQFKFRYRLPSLSPIEGEYIAAPTVGVRNGVITTRGLWETAKILPFPSFH